MVQCIQHDVSGALSATLVHVVGQIIEMEEVVHEVTAHAKLLETSIWIAHRREEAGF
jgi:hypothetical protein